MTEEQLAFRNSLGGALLPAAHRMLLDLVPNYLEEELHNPSTRQLIVKCADEALVRKYPMAKIIPADVRREILRKQLDLILDDVLFNDHLLEPSSNGRFKRFIVRVGGKAGLTTNSAAKVICNVIGPDWKVRAMPKTARSFEAAAAANALNLDQAWDLAHRLSKERRIRDVEVRK